MCRVISLLILLSAILVSYAAETNYFCIVCGQGPLSGRIWISKWGAICDDCYKLENHCLLCGLPVRDGDGHVKTGDGRFICRFDKPNAVLDVTEAREVFLDARRELVGLFGRGFALNYPDVTVNLFDVDYWSENGRSDGLHKFGFSNTRRTPKGECTHEVVFLSGRLRDEIAATAAHEYTHLWINENLVPGRKLDADTVEAVCELVAFHLMAARRLPEQQQKILDNPYTHGEIRKLVALEQERGLGYILNWLKTGTTATLETQAAARVAPVKIPAMASTKVPPPLPAALKLVGLLLDGENRRAVINGVSFAPGDTKPVKLRDRIVQVSCRAILPAAVLLRIDARPDLVTLKIGEEKFVP